MLNAEQASQAIPMALVAELEPNGQSIAIGEQGETVEVWEYFAENINDFATAKTIVDHFAENPKLLDSNELDLHGLFVRAKLTIKRQQIAYAKAQAALEEARAHKRTARGVLKSFWGFTTSLWQAVETNPTPAAIAAAFALLWYLR